MEIERSSGILLHSTSLPGPYGIGDLGPDAYRFADFLAAAGQSWWQVLPLGPTGFGNSPYMSLSAFGGNPYLISLDLLAKDGLLDPAEIANPPPFPADRVDFPRVADFKMSRLRRSFQCFRDRHAGTPLDFVEFTRQHACWVEDYALFRALKDAHDGRVWTEWEEGIARRRPDALERWRRELQDEIQFGIYLEYMFLAQWTALRRYCRARGVRMIGDLPIYVAHDSAEVWANPELFHLDARGMPVVVAGVPPDYFSATGQRWGNPLYRWPVMAARGYRWWKERLRATFELLDLVRIDHFRGFEAYWEIPAPEPTATQGHWVTGPGADFFEAMRSTLPDLPMIAEDLGLITPEVEALRDRFGFPGMRILQMAFGDDPKASDYRPHNHVPNAVVYTATHDHNTTVGWFTAEPGAQTTQSAAEVERERRAFLEYAHSDGREVHWDMIRLAMASVARLAIVPLQDLLGLGHEARMNLPGTLRGNWEWRVTADRLDDAIAARLRRMSETYDRVRA